MIFTKKFNSKSEVRALIKERLAHCTPEQLPIFSRTACNCLMRNPHFIDAQTIMLFCSLPGEVDTIPLLQELHTVTNKQILLPVVFENEMIPFEYHRDTELRKGAFGILEPNSKPFQEKIDLVVVPGLAFDVQGNRIGRGKGFYDRFLKTSDSYKIGFAFSFQLFTKIPSELHDISVDEVVTDEYFQIS